ncbi:MAG: hypothetical protein M0Q53_08675 [Prolixibacteraceae bacterium]|jgi:hypothetical protein|nr:hypothetical protein [Prolixibacteraceae bacterium]
METNIYQAIQGIEPEMEILKRQHIVEKYGYNKGVNERKSSKYFGMLWEAFAWAAILGFYHDKRKPLQGEPSKAFKYSTIARNGPDILDSLILFVVAKEGYGILKDSGKVNKVIEEYANGGFEIIFTILKEKGSDYFGDESNFLQEILDRKPIIEKEKNKLQPSKNTEIESIIDDGEGGNFKF